MSHLIKFTQYFNIFQLPICLVSPMVQAIQQSQIVLDQQLHCFDVTNMHHHWKRVEITLYLYWYAKVKVLIFLSFFVITKHMNYQKNLYELYFLATYTFNNLERTQLLKCHNAEKRCAFTTFFKYITPKHK